MSLKMNGYEVDVFEGEVVAQNTHHETRITGGEIHQRYGYISGDPIQSESIKRDELYLRLKDGTEISLSTTGAFQYRVGHKLTVSQFRVGSGGWFIGYAYNHNMKQFGQLGSLYGVPIPWSFASFALLICFLFGCLLLSQLVFSGLMFVGGALVGFYLKTMFINADQIKEPCKLAIDRYLAGEPLDQGPPPDQKDFC